MPFLIYLNSIEIAKNLLLANIDMATIMKITGLTKKEIVSLTNC